MPQYLKKISDISVVPSLWDDPCPNTVLEAQAMGLPIITTRRGGIPEEVTDDNAILLTTDTDFKNHLKEAILLLYHQADKREKMGNAGVKNAQYYNKNRYAEDFFRGIALP